MKIMTNEVAKVYKAAIFNKYAEKDVSVRKGLFKQQSI